MRVCMFTRAVLQQGKGGMEDHIAMLCRGLAKKGIDISVITTLHQQGKEYEVLDGVKYYYVGGSKPKKYSADWWGNSVQKFVQLHGETPFDAVHSQSAGGFGFARENLGKKLQIPVVTSLHGTTIDEIQTQLNKLANTHSIRSYSDLLDTLRVFPKMAVQLHSYFFIDSKYLSSSDLIIATSNEQKKKLLKYLHVPEGKIEIIYNAIDEKLFSPSERYVAVKELGVMGKPILLCVARLEREKGVQNAILAMHELLKEYPAALLLIVGDGSYRKSLEELAKRLCVHHSVTFTGFVQFEKLPTYFNACDIFLNPTIRQDGYDLTVLEAMSCERPVIASKIGSMPTAIEHGKDGIMIKPGSVQDLVFAVNGLVADREKAKLIAKAARKKILENFSCESMISKTILAYREAIAMVKKR
ncbi:hypothetical protein AUJ17_04950 [Candidatus Micrarchaeota archaeon CG1_02_47_40]|nr:MAG: hypothetical protein AUJ17_04950 [Candidatus Micrarchaeota archaeon CG1_02_47_40]